MNRHAGSTLDSLFEETGELQEVRLRALKKGVAETARLQMAVLGLSKTRLAARMGTSRSQVDRVLDPDDTSITLATFAKLADALELEASFQLSSPAAAMIQPVQEATVISLATFRKPARPVGFQEIDRQSYTRASVAVCGDALIGTAV
jgi:antitoxin HicB